MKEKHMKLFQQGLNEHHFDLVAGHLVSALKDTGVKQEELDEAVGVLGPLRGAFEEAAREVSSAAPAG